MAGHSKWANIKHRKARQDAKRGAGEQTSWEHPGGAAPGFWEQAIQRAEQDILAQKWGPLTSQDI